MATSGLGTADHSTSPITHNEMDDMPGKFWPKVRQRIWEKAQDVFQGHDARTMEDDFKGITAERTELREAGFYYEAKVLVLREVNREKKGLPPEEERENGN